MQQISQVQFAFIVIIFIISTADIFLPASLVKTTGQDAWLAVIFGSLFSVLAVLINNALAQKFGGKSFADYLKKLLGNWGGTFVLFIYLCYYIYLNMVVMGQLGQLMNVSFYRQTPVWVIALGVSLVSVYGIFCGIETIVRFLSLGFVVIILVRMVMMGLTLNSLDFLNFLPIMEEGFSPIGQGGFSVAAWLVEVMLLIFFVPYVAEPKKLGKTTLIAMMVSAVLILISSLVMMGYLGLYQAANSTFSLLEITRSLQISFVEGLETLIISMWYLSIFFKIIIIYFIAGTILQDLVGANCGHKLIVPLAIFSAVVSSGYFINVDKTITAAIKVWPGLSFFMAVLMPLGLLLMAVIKKAWNKGDELKI